MKKEFILNYLSESYKDTGILSIYYDFSGASGLFVPNNLYPINNQFGKINSNFFINKEYSPGIFISCYNEQAYTGSGVFQGQNNLKVLNNLSGNNMTLFYNFGNISCDKIFSLSSLVNLPKRILLQNWALDDGGTNINGEYKFNGTTNYNFVLLTNAYVNTGVNTTQGISGHPTIYYNGGNWSFVSDGESWSNAFSNLYILPLSNWVENNAQGPAGSISILENSAVNFNAKNYQLPTGYIQVLSYLESKPDSANQFEIILGLNDVNKLTLEFSGGNEYYKSTNFTELAFQNIGSLRLNNNNIEYTYFDVVEDEIYNKNIALTGNYLKQEKNIYIGNMPTGKYRNGYTGYFGIVDGFTAYNQYIDQSSCAELARLFIKTGEQLQQINVTGITYNVIQSGFLNPTGIIGTGITGYQLIPSTEVINASCGDNCIVYLRSGITGVITGEKIEYKIISQQQFSTDTSSIKYNLYDQEYAGRFAKNHIVFNTKLDSDDIFEMQLYKDVETKVEIPSFAPISNIYISNDILSNRSLLIFFNGQNISSGNYQLLNNDTSFTIDKINDGTNDLVLYTISSFSDTDTFIFDNTGQNINSNLFKYVGKLNNNVYDIYLNGQKLISGLNYTISGSNTGLYLRESSPSGEIYVIRDNFFYKVTGNNFKYYSPSGINYNNERIWLNGLYQNKGENYILTSCTNKSLLTNNELELKNKPIFTEDYYRFNLV
jgi:hypothetical protein